jgi:ADP-heptose:LPS heptosyltransferase
LLGGGSLAIAYPALLAIKQLPHVKCMRLVTTRALVPFAESLAIFDELIVLRDSDPWSLALDSLAAMSNLFLSKALVDLEMHSRLTTVFCLLTCAYTRVGLCTRQSRWRKGLSTHLIYCGDQPVYSTYDEVAALFGAKPDLHSSCVVFRSRLPRYSNQSFDKRIRVGIAPCCSHLAKQRELEDSDWITVLQRRYTTLDIRRLEVHLFGAQCDRSRLTRLAALISLQFSDIECVNHAGEGTLLDTITLLVQMSALLCVDSALLHFARLAGVPTVSFWGPTDPRSLMRPLGAARDVIYYDRLPCSPCAHVNGTLPCRGNNICIQGAIVSMRQRTRRSRSDLLSVSQQTRSLVAIRSYPHE